MTTLGITNGSLLLPDGSVRPGDVLIDQTDGEILQTGDVDAPDSELDASGALVVPGLINAHTHTPMTLMRGVADGKPLEAWLEQEIRPLERRLSGADLRAGSELACLEMIRNGVTGFVDMYFGMDEIVETILSAGLRARVGLGISTREVSEERAWRVLARGIATAKRYDEAGDGRITTAVMPHTSDAVGPEYAPDLVEKARNLGVPFHYHANETRETTRGVRRRRGARPLEYAAEHGLLGEDDFVAHGVHVDDAELRTLSDSGAGVVHCPTANAKLASGVAPVQRYVDEGVPVGLGTDGAASNNTLDVFREMKLAALLSPAETGSGTALDAETVVSMATEDGARVAGFDSGRIEDGANADIAVVDVGSAHTTPRHDLVSHLVYSVNGSDVRHTVCDGQILMRDRTVLTLDETRVRERAAMRASQLVDCRD